MYPAFSIAKYFIRKGIDDSRPVTNMKLQKLIYFSHGWHLAYTGEPLIDEFVEAWQYGPVVPSIYHSFKSLGNLPIDKPEFIEHVERTLNGELTRVELSAEDVAFLDDIWQSHKDFTGRELSSITHLEGTPWSRVFETHKEFKGTDIPNDLIKNYFTQLATDSQRA